jgi:hypothetical protein
MPERRADMSTCRATRINGQACSAAALPSGYCWAHDAGMQEKRAQARARGGASRRNTVRAAKVMPAELQALRGSLFAALDSVRRGEMDARTGTAIATLSTAILRWYSVAEVEARLAVLEGREERQA